MSKTSGSSTLERAPIDLMALREEGRQNLVDVLQEVRDALRAGMESLAYALERIGRALRPFQYPTLQVAGGGAVYAFVSARCGRGPSLY